METLKPVEIKEATNVYIFSNSKSQDLFTKVTKELRCSVCQNQSLADSAAPLAIDLRQAIYEQVNRNVSEQEIIEFVTSRYGNFVLYQPPLTLQTALLWGGPLVLLILGCYVITRFFQSSPK